MKALTYNHQLFPFQSKWTTIEDNKIHYIDEGAGRILLFSHAAIGSTFMYRGLVKTLRDHYRCIAMDYPGFGLSQEADAYTFSISSQATVLQKFIEQLGLKDTTLLGHDSPSGLVVAMWQPELFRALILTDTQIFPTSEYPRIHTMLGLVGSGVFQSLNARTNFLLKGTVNFGIRTKKLSAEEKQQYYALHASPKRRRAICQVLHSIRAEQRLMHELKAAFENQLNCKPMLMIYGEKDPIQELGIPERIQRMVENAELHFVKGEGHFPHEAQPEFMSAIIDRWMQKLAVN
ncbi:MAG: alpha/beta fold hydrolase [Anaerolineales bacterium]